jgi:uncharacterized protein (TIGR02145 family)
MKEYRKVTIGTQTWMAENLNYNESGSQFILYCDYGPVNIHGGGCFGIDNASECDTEWGEVVTACVNHGSRCYGNSDANCTKYGRLYSWGIAKTVCPSGWHLPSDAEWTRLTDYVGGYSTAGTKLKAASGWNEDGNGTDDYGFSALPGGNGGSGGDFISVGGYGYWWSATEYNDNASYAYHRYMSYYGEDVSRDYYYKGSLHSVRCLQY